MHAALALLVHAGAASWQQPLPRAFGVDMLLKRTVLQPHMSVDDDLLAKLEARAQRLSGDAAVARSEVTTQRLKPRTVHVSISTHVSAARAFVWTGH